MRRRLLLDRLLVLNDYAALAHALGSLRPDEGRAPVVGEGGHVSLSGADDGGIASSPYCVVALTMSQPNGPLRSGLVDLYAASG